MRPTETMFSVIECKDKGEHCDYWKKQGYCSKDYVQYMTKNCPKTCENVECIRK